MYISGDSNAGMETSAPLVNKALFHWNSDISQMLPGIIPILHLCLVDSLLQIL